MTLYEILMINAEGSELRAAICKEQHDDENVVKWLSKKNDYINQARNLTIAEAEGW